MIAIIDMLLLAILLVICCPVIITYRLLTGDKYMPPDDRLCPFTGDTGEVL